MDCVVLKVQPDAQDEGGQQDEREDDQTARRVLAKAYAPKSSPGASIDLSRPGARYVSAAEGRAGHSRLQVGDGRGGRSRHHPLFNERSKTSSRRHTCPHGRQRSELQEPLAKRARLDSTDRQLLAVREDGDMTTARHDPDFRDQLDVGPVATPEPKYFVG